MLPWSNKQNTLIWPITRDYNPLVSLISRRRVWLSKLQDWSRCHLLLRFFSHMKYVFIIVLFPLLVEIIPVLHVFDEEARGNNKAKTCIGLWNALKRVPKPLRVHLHQCRAAPLENTSVWAQSFSWVRCRPDVSPVATQRIWTCWLLWCLIHQWWMVNKAIHVLHFQRFHSKFTKRWCQPKPLREIFPSCWRDRPSVQVELLPPYLSTWTIKYICEVLPQSLCLTGRWWPQH